MKASGFLSLWRNAAGVCALAVAWGLMPVAIAERLPGELMVQAPLVSPSEAQAILSQRQIASTAQHLAAPTLTASTTVEIQELARGLKNDPDLIYQYVHDQIAYTPGYGALRGVAGTLLDKRGNPFDQAALMVALLRQAGFTANYVFGQVRLTSTQLRNWLATTNNNAATLQHLLATAGIPATAYQYGDGSLAYMDLDHVWVRATVGGGTYVFDPSLKTHIISTGIDVASAMGYNQGTFLATALAGATSDADSLQHVNAAGMQNALRGYAINLINYIKNNNPTATVEQVVGGQSIVPVTGTLRQTSLPYQRTVVAQWTEIPDQYRVTLEIAHVGIDMTVFADEIYGKRLTIFYDSLNRPVLRLDGTVLATGTSAPGYSNQQLTLTVDHPYAGNGGTFADDSMTMYVLALPGYGLVIVNGWGGTSFGQAARHRQVARESAFAGAASSSEAVLGSSLAVIASTYLAERSRTDELTDRLHQTMTFQHHILGVCGQRDAPYMDIPMSMSTTTAMTADPLTEDAVGYSHMGHGSAFEWGAIEQVQPAEPAISTIKILDIANSQSQKIFDATSANYLTIVKPQLTNFGAAAYYYIEAYLDAGYRVIVHQNGQTGEGNWSGVAFMTITPNGDGISHLILGNLSGGYGEYPFTINGTPYHWSDDSFRHDKTREPIDLATGAYLYQNTDLSLGTGEFPFGLAFSRSYNSGSRLVDGPLGLGWTHNYSLGTSVSSNPAQGLGEISPIDAAAALAEIYVATDVLKGTKTKERLVIATLAHRWFMDQLINNSVSVSQPGNTQQYSKLPDGTYNPPPGAADTLTRNADTSFTLSTKGGDVMNFDITGKLVTWADRNDNTVTFSYSGNQLQTIDNGLGRTLSLTYDGVHLTQVADNAGRTVSYQYDATGNLTIAADAAGNETRFTYDVPGRLQSVFLPVAPAQPNVTNVYDGLGRVMIQSDARLNQSQYFIAGSRSEEIDPLANSTVRYFDSAGRTTLNRDALGNEIASAYDGLGRLIMRTFPDGNSQQFTYDARHNLIALTAFPKPGSVSAPIASQFTYEPTFNQQETATDPLGRVTTFIYDDNGNLLQRDSPSVGGVVPQTFYTYNGRGQILQVTDAAGRVRTYAYAGTGDLLTLTTDPAGLNLATHTDYDAVGNVAHVTDPLGRVTTFGYDALRRQTQLTAPAPFGYVMKYNYDPDGQLTSTDKQTNDPLAPWQTSQFTYSPTGKELTQSTPLGRTTTQEFDAADRLSAVTDAADRTTQYQYDALGRLYREINALGELRSEHLYASNGPEQSVKDANGNIVTYQSDDFDRLTKTIYPDGTFEELTYDAANNITQKRTRTGQLINYTYDELNRLLTKTLPGRTIQYTYDLIGNSVDVTDATGTTHHIYDNAGRLVSVTYPGSRTVSYQYDAAGNRTRLTYPDGYFVTYEYDSANRLTHVRANGAALLVQYTYDALSRRTSAVFGNSAFTTYVYDLDNNLTSLTHQFSDSAVTFAYGYDDVRNRSSLSVSNDDYVYKPTQALQKTYATNNLNEYSTVNGIVHTYDAAGNLVSDGVNTCTYDAENRLGTVTNVSALVTNAYDGSGRRVTKAASGATTTYIYDGAHVIMELDGAGQLLRRYVYADNLDEPISLVTTNTQYFYHFDVVGSVVALSGASGSVAEKYNYDEFGKPSQTSAVGNPYLFTGREYDPETGLYNYRARFYAPSLGRFLQVDPAGGTSGSNAYAYVENNPLSAIDPLGESACKYLSRTSPWLFGVGRSTSFSIGNTARGNFHFRWRNTAGYAEDIRLQWLRGGREFHLARDPTRGWHLAYEIKPGGPANMHYYYNRSVKAAAGGFNTAEIEYYTTSLGKSGIGAAARIVPQPVSRVWIQSGLRRRGRVGRRRCGLSRLGNRRSHQRLSPRRPRRPDDGRKRPGDARVQRLLELVLHPQPINPDLFGHRPGHRSRLVAGLTGRLFPSTEFAKVARSRSGGQTLGEEAWFAFRRPSRQSRELRSSRSPASSSRRTWTDPHDGRQGRRVGHENTLRVRTVAAVWTKCVVSRA